MVEEILPKIVALRKEGNSLREIGHIIGYSYEMVRLKLRKSYPDIKCEWISENQLPKLIGCRMAQITTLKNRGLLNPKHIGGRNWYDNKEYEKILLLLQRECPHCGDSIPIYTNMKYKYCSKCSLERRRYNYPFLSAETRAKMIGSKRKWREKRQEEEIKFLKGG